MDLEFLTPCIRSSLMFTNLNTSSHIGLYKEEGGLTSKGTHARKSTPSTQTTHVTTAAPANPSRRPQPVTTSDIPIKLLSFIGIPACSLNPFSHLFLHLSLTGRYVLFFIFNHSTIAGSAFPAMAQFEVRYIFVIVLFMVK